MIVCMHFDNFLSVLTLLSAPLIFFFSRDSYNRYPDMFLGRTSQMISNISKTYQNPLFLYSIYKRYKKTKKSGNNYIVEPTTMKIQKFDPETYDLSGVPPVITKYSTNGFDIQGNKIHGPVAILQQGFYAWKVKTWTDITIESLQLFFIGSPPIEILVIGTGDKIEFVSPLVRQHLKKLNIGVEILDTRNAMSTFNFLLEERRSVGAAMLPVTYISPV